MGRVIRGRFPDPPQDEGTDSVPEDDDEEPLVAYELIEDDDDD